MQGLLGISRAIDRLNGWLGRLVAWLSLAMVLVTAFNAVARYLGRFLGRDLSSNTYIELQWYLFSLIFLLGAAYTLRRDEHVRVDVLYSALSRKSRAWIDLIGSLAFLLPFCLLVLWVSWPYVANSWALREGSPDPGGLARYPIKTAIPVCFVLLFLQGVSEAIKRVAILRGLSDKELDDEGEHRSGVA
ncbi:MAG: TRAP transporter small permease subunit [Planctomycetota bacterium]|nr:TRAP transporter small permease subunit [Planctomycetota bacterium]